MKNLKGTEVVLVNKVMGIRSCLVLSLEFISLLIRQKGLLIPASNQRILILLLIRILLRLLLGDFVELGE